MNKSSILRSSSAKMIALYVAATLILYLGFWAGWYFMKFNVALLISGAILAAGAIMMLIVRKTWGYIAFVAITSAAMGMCISAFFIATQIVPSRFFGLVLLIMLGYKTVQMIFGEILHKMFNSRKPFFAMLTGLAVIELIALIGVGLTAEYNGLNWQVFFALVICFFYTCGQLTLRKKSDNEFWRSIAIAYLMGFIFIFILVFLLILCVISEDGDPLSFLFDGIGEISLGNSKTRPSSSKGASIDLGDFGDIGDISGITKKKKPPYPPDVPSGM